MEITTPRLVLRTAERSDLEGIHAVFSDVTAMRWWATPPHQTIEESEAWLTAMIANGPDHPDFIIECGGDVIGKVGFWAPPEIGYILHPSHWGRGLASEALTAAIDHLFAHHSFDHITADVDPANDGSIRVLERTGFTKIGSAERTMQVGGVWVDSLFYALTRSAWAVQRKA
jgi:ribosomal-protein-alanine N-acetyltransferase